MKIVRVDFLKPVSFSSGTHSTLRLSPDVSFKREGDFMHITYRGKATMQHLSNMVVHYEATPTAPLTGAAK